MKKLIKKHLKKKQLPRIIAIIGGEVVGFALGSYFGAVIGIVAAFFLEELLTKALKKNYVRH